jgi:hypothetical protein
MKRNEDPNIVVMDRRVAEQLMHFAKIGAYEAGDDISNLERHVRRFNAPVAADYQQQQDQAREEFRQKQQRVKDLLRTHAGETVYICVEHAKVLTPVKLLSVSKGNKGAVRTYNQMTHLYREEVDIERVHTEVPADYRPHEWGSWKGRFVHNSKTVHD